MRLRLDRCREEAGVIFSYFCVSLLVLYPLLPHLFSRLPFASNGDIRLSLAILFSDLKHITQGDLQQLYQLPVLFPLSHTLTAGINLFGQSLLVLPLYLAHLRNVYLIYNLLTFLAYVAAGYCAYRFVREWVPERWIAWLSGALYILLPFRVHNIPHLNLMFNFPIPMTLLFFSRYLKNGRDRDLVSFFLWFLVQLLFDLSLGLFLGIALGLFFLVRQALFGLSPRRAWLRLAAASVLFLLIVTSIFFPYMSRETSFSIIGGITSVAPDSFRPPLSFYVNWSYLLLFFKRAFWSQSPFCPGISMFVLFMLAFVPYLEGRLQKGLALACTSLLVVPALAVPVIFHGWSVSTWNRLCGGSLLMFLIGLSLLLFMIRKKAPRELLWLTITWMLLQFYTSQISLPFFNLFQGLARLFPLLLRARHVRPEYILLLLFFAVSAFGLAYFYRRFRNRKIVLWLAVALILAERVRWPVSAGALADDRPVYRTLYQSLSPYPEHFGLMELPFYPESSNHYPLYTRYHDKHTYHGLINYLSDPYRLEGRPKLRAAGGFPGLSDPQFTDLLKNGGIRLILVFKDKIIADPDLGPEAWSALEGRIREGEARGLYQSVARAEAGTLLVLSEREQGARIRYFLPRFSLIGKKRLLCDIDAHQETEAEFLFNERTVKRHRPQAAAPEQVPIDLKGCRIDPQFNYLEIRSGPSLELLKVRIE